MARPSPPSTTCGWASTTTATTRERSDDHQRRDTPITNPIEPTRYAFEYPGEAGYPDGKGTLSQDQIVLIDELLDDPHAPAFDFEVVKDEKLGIYDAIVGDREVPGLTYDVARRLPPRTNPREARTTSSSPRSSTT
jgi:hypothetical protein